MPEIQDYESAKYLRIAVISPPKVGKTHLAGTFPDPAFIDADLSLTTIATKEYREKYPHRILYESFEDEVDDRGAVVNPQAFNKILKQLSIWSSDPKVKTIVLDSLTSIGRLCLNAAIVVNASTGKSKTLARLDPKLDRPLLLDPTQADMGVEGGGISQILDLAMRLQKNLVVNCHERDEYSASGARLSSGPLLTGSRARATFGRWFDEVWRLTIENVDGKPTRVLYTKADSMYPSLGSRWGLPEKIIDPSWQKILPLLKERGYTPA